MPLPLIPVVISALAAGGTLVPHAAGGLIVTSASGYVAGTYLSTATITALLVGGATALGAGAAVVSGFAATIIGSAGIFGTTIGASGVTGVLMSLGILASTPIWVPIAIAGMVVGASYGAFRYHKLRKKLLSTPEGVEAQFTETEAKVIEWLLRRFAKKEKCIILSISRICGVQEYGKWRTEEPNNMGRSAPNYSAYSSRLVERQSTGPAHGTDHV